MQNRSIFVLAVVVASMAAVGSVSAFDSSFTVDFSAAGEAANWQEARASQNAVVIATGETTPQGVAYSPAPDADPGFPNNGWLRAGRSANEALGVTFLRPTGAQGGSTTTIPEDYTVSVDIFCLTDSFTTRYDIGLLVRYPEVETGDPLRIYYSNGAFAPTLPAQFGIRGPGLGNTATPGSTPLAGNQWVRFRATVIGNQLTYGIDLDRNGTEDLTGSLDLLTTAFSERGYPGVFVTSNDQNAGFAAVVNSFGYFDNFNFEIISNVEDWMTY